MTIEAEAETDRPARDATLPAAAALGATASGSTTTRGQVQEQITAVLDVVLGVLALVTLALVLVELTLALPEPWSSIVVEAQVAIWVAFGIAFAFDLLLAPSKTRYLRSNWLLALSLVLPALRVLRVARALRILRTTRAARALGLANVSASFNRVYIALKDFFRTSQLAYLVALTVVVVTTGGVAGYFFERDDATTINTLWDGVWWAATLVTTINSQAEEVTLEGRLIGLALRLFGVAIFGYLTAHLAVYLLGSHNNRSNDNAHIEELTRSVRELSRTVEDLRLTTSQLTNGASAASTSARADESTGGPAA